MTSNLETRNDNKWNYYLGNIVYKYFWTFEKRTFAILTLSKMIISCDANWAFWAATEYLKKIFCVSHQCLKIYTVICVLLCFLRFKLKQKSEIRWHSWHFRWKYIFVEYFLSICIGNKGTKYKYAYNKLDCTSVAQWLSNWYH